MADDVRENDATGDSGRVYPRDSAEFDRFLNFTDAVIAIAMTLLVLGIELPRPEAAEADSASVFSIIGDLWPQIFAFLLGFVIIGFYWIGHHRFVAGLRAVDFPMMIWNLSFLLAVVFLPFMSQLMGYYGGNEQAVALYAAWFVVLGSIDLAGYLLAWRRGLLDRAPSPAMVRFQCVSRMNAPVVFLVSIGIAIWISPQMATWSWLLIWPISALTSRHPPDR